MMFRSSRGGGTWQDSGKPRSYCGQKSRARQMKTAAAHIAGDGRCRLRSHRMMATTTKTGCSSPIAPERFANDPGRSQIQASSQPRRQKNGDPDGNRHRRLLAAHVHNARIRHDPHAKLSSRPPGLARSAQGADPRARPADRRSAPPSVGPARLALSARRTAGRYQQRPQHRRHRVRAGPRDVPRRRARSKCGPSARPSSSTASPP